MLLYQEILDFFAQIKCLSIHEAVHEAFANKFTTSCRIGVSATRSQDDRDTAAIEHTDNVSLLCSSRGYSQGALSCDH